MMVTNYYNASNKFAYPIRKEPKPYTENVKHPEKCESPMPKKLTQDTDLVIILGLLAVLFLTDCQDRWLMLALLYLAFG